MEGWGTPWFHRPLNATGRASPGAGQSQSPARGMRMAAVQASGVWIARGCRSAQRNRAGQCRTRSYT